MNVRLRTEIEQKRHALEQLCRQYALSRLDAFGSGTTDRWSVESSDLDFVVAFRGVTVSGLADRYLGLALDLEALFGRPVDLLTERSIKNPYFRQSVEAARVPIYAE